jgi:hypothetical protein
MNAWNKVKEATDAYNAAVNNNESASQRSKLLKNKTRLTNLAQNIVSGVAF